MLRVPVQRLRSGVGGRAVASVDVSPYRESLNVVGGCRGLIDTGAETSGISASLARELGLSSEGNKRTMATASDPSVRMPAHDLWITLPFVDSFDIYDAYEFPDSLKNVDVIIGMDILMRLDGVMRKRERVIELFLPREEGIFRRRFIRL